MRYQISLYGYKGILWRKELKTTGPAAQREEKAWVFDVKALGLDPSCITYVNFVITNVRMILRKALWDSGRMNLALVYGRCSVSDTTKSTDITGAIIPQERVKEMLFILKWQKMLSSGMLPHISVLICFRVESKVSL